VTPSSLIDIGANLTHASFEPDLDEVLHSARHAGVEQLVITGASIEGSEAAIQLASQHKLYATAGIHPHHASEASHDNMMRLRELVSDPHVKAVGETGLDYFRNFSPKEDQIRSFEGHIELAIDTGLPMFLHERDAHEDFAAILAPHRDKLKRVVVHCFTGDETALSAYIDLDCYIGITGWIADERRGTHLASLVGSIPPDRLLIETDAPYLMPRNIQPKPKHRRNEPGYLTYVCQAVSDCLEESYEDVARRTTRNARRFFGLKDQPDQADL
jgi:TatD DNase family protein